MGKKKRVIIGGIFFVAQTLLSGCDSGPDQQVPVQSGREGENAMARKDSGVLTELQEVAPGKFQIIQEYPTTATGAVINRLDGSREVLSEEKVRALVNDAGSGQGFGMGAVLASGLFGYMIGKTPILNPDVYRGGDLYGKSLANRDLLDQRRREEEDRRYDGSRRAAGWSYYGGSRRTSVEPPKSAPAGKTGFFSRLTSSLRSFGS